MRTLEEIQKEIEIHEGLRAVGNPYFSQAQSLLIVTELLLLILEELKTQK